MVVFKFSKYGDSMGTRLLGARIRADLRPLLDGDERVVLDFTGLDTVTNSFADECIAKLLLEMPLDELKAKTTFDEKPRTTPWTVAAMPLAALSTTP